MDNLSKKSSYLITILFLGYKKYPVISYVDISLHFVYIVSV